MNQKTILTPLQLIQEKIKQDFNPIYLKIMDESFKHTGHKGVLESGGGHFRLWIKSNNFKDISRIEAHRLIYASLESFFSQGIIHALAIHIQSQKEE